MDSTAPDKMFYVTVVRDTQTRLVAGPFTSFSDAHAYVEPARTFLTQRDPRSHFDGFGVTAATTRPGGTVPVGGLNESLGVTPTPPPPPDRSAVS